MDHGPKLSHRPALKYVHSRDKIVGYGPKYLRNFIHGSEFFSEGWTVGHTGPAHSLHKVLSVSPSYTEMSKALTEKLNLETFKKPPISQMNWTIEPGQLLKNFRNQLNFFSPTNT